MRMKLFVFGILLAGLLGWQRLNHAQQISPQIHRPKLAIVAETNFDFIINPTVPTNVWKDVDGLTIEMSPPFESFFHYKCFTNEYYNSNGVFFTIILDWTTGEVRWSTNGTVWQTNR
jgi:hypothetical protein